MILPRPLSSKVPAWFERKFDFTFPADQWAMTQAEMLLGDPALGKLYEAA